jgi:hypothetical protein
MDVVKFQLRADYEVDPLSADKDQPVVKHLTDKAGVVQRDISERS